MKNTIVRFKQKDFAQAVSLFMETQMIRQNKKIGLREFAKQIQISASTLSRLKRGSMPETEVFLRICFWMRVFPNTFYNWQEEITIDKKKVKKRI